ncbi:MAG TPA: cupin domain-containing protein [Chitinophagaceae bacterium]|nr:cupin domain-containing protein [Chitinophagaceae bacterium]
MKACLFVLVNFIAAITAQAQYSNEIKIEKLLKTDTTETGQHIDYPDIANEEVSVLKVTIPPGKSTGWHKHLFPVFAYVLQGTLTVQQEHGKKIRFKKNTSVAESINMYHTGINEGKEAVVLIVFYMGEKDQPVSVKKE